MTQQFKELKHYVCANAAWLSDAHLHVLAKLHWDRTLTLTCAQGPRRMFKPSMMQVPQLRDLRPQQQAASP